MRRSGSAPMEWTRALCRAKPTLSCPSVNFSSRPEGTFADGRRSLSCCLMIDTTCRVFSRGKRALFSKLCGPVHFAVDPAQNCIPFFLRHRSGFAQVTFESVDRVPGLPVFDFVSGHVPRVDR